MSDSVHIPRPERGFSLIEALIAIAILIVGCGVLAHLAVMSTRANQAARAVTRAALLAANLAEDLSSQGSLSGASLPVSPADALSVNVAGYCDFFDAAGAALGPGPAPPSGAAFARRWSVSDLPGGPAGARLVQVIVLPWPQAAGLGATDARRLELTRLILVRAGP